MWILSFFLFFQLTIWIWTFILDWLANLIMISFSLWSFFGCSFLMYLHNNLCFSPRWRWYFSAPWQKLLEIRFDHILQICRLCYLSAFRMRPVTVLELLLSSKIISWGFVGNDNILWWMIYPRKVLTYVFCYVRAVGSFLEFTHDEVEVVSLDFFASLAISWSSYSAKYSLLQTSDVLILNLMTR